MNVVRLSKIRNYIGAFFLFNVFFIFIISAFLENTPYLFDMKIVKELKASGLIDDIRELGWNGHYIWALISFSVTTYFVSFLTGAMAQENGGKVSLLSSIPSDLGWVFLFYMMALSGGKYEGQTGFIIVSIIAIPLNVYIAYMAGCAGEEIQKDEYNPNTILGIWKYHLIWIVFPVYWYGLRIVYIDVKFISLNFIAVSYFDHLIAFLYSIPLLAWLSPPVIVYYMLSGKLFANIKPLYKGFICIITLLLGSLLASIIEYCSISIINKLLQLFR